MLCRGGRQRGEERSGAVRRGRLVRWSGRTRGGGGREEREDARSGRTRGAGGREEREDARSGRTRGAGGREERGGETAGEREDRREIAKETVGSAYRIASSRGSLGSSFFAFFLLL